MRRWICEKWPENFISAADATQRGPFKDTARARKALRLLEGEGWVIPVEGGAGAIVHGKCRREAWRVIRGAS